jgi:hypothetical protein
VPRLDIINDILREVRRKLPVTTINAYPTAAQSVFPRTWKKVLLFS